MKCFDLNKNVCGDQVEEVELCIEKPAVPFAHKLKRRLRPNTTFIIQGVVDDNAVRFEVNLVAGLNDKADIVFHFNPRLEQLYAARNSRFAGTWGTEEGASQLKFPFRCRQPFHLEIYATDVKYLVAVDGVHYCTYKHRAPVASVVGLMVEGGVRLSQVLQFSTSTYPSPPPPLLVLPDAKTSLNKNGAQGVSVVYNLKLHLQPQSSIIVQGVVNDNANRFEVDLLTILTGHGEKPNIGFHFNPRLDQLYVARNTHLLGVWGQEEGGAHEHFPFHRGRPFYLEIYATTAKFLVAVDGMHYTSYRYRVPLDSILKVHVHGGVTLSNVHLQNTPQYPSPLPQFLSSSDQEVIVHSGDFSKTSNLKVPFIHELKSRLHPQSSIIIQGVVANNATRFEVDFIIGHEEQPDVAFHFNPRLDQLYVARNARFNNVWGHEEGDSQVKFPFRCGQPFFLEIFLTETKFMVAVDGCHYCSFAYRASLVSVTRVCVEGGVRLSQVQLHASSNYPAPMPQYLPCPDMQPVVLRTSSPSSKSEPFVHKLDFKLSPQTSLIVQGEVADNGIRFALNLLAELDGRTDIAFHFNPRLNTRYTARNSKLGGSWGPEEGSTKEKFPFRNGFPFYLEMYFTQSKLMVAVDGVHYCSFKYRIPLERVTTVQVEGGVSVSQVLVHATASYPSTVLEFVPRPENKTGLQAVRAGSVSSIHQVLPFYHELRSHLHPQSAIFIQGVVDNRAVRLEVNLLMGRGEKPDIAFHFNPRMDQFYSARNSRLNGSWGPEEGNSHQRFPFVRGKPFYLEIFHTHTEFLVAVNGTHYCSYCYRVPLFQVTCVEVRGMRDVRAEVLPASSYPSPPPADIPCLYRLRLSDNGVTDNASQITPVYAALNGPLRANSKIEIRGKVKLLPYSFYMNLQEGSEHWPHPLVPFHVSVRFCQGGEQVALANSWQRKKWADEEKVHNRFLFTPGYPFTMRILCHDEKFMVHVDDQFLLAFKHRMPHKTVDTLFIQGDVFIYSISTHL